MRTVLVRRALAGATVAEAQALWLDLHRWPSFVDGFGTVARIEGEWPRPGTRLIWDSLRDGRGRVVENVVSFEPGTSHETRVEDPQLTGTQAARFDDLDDGCLLTLELRYELKRPGFGGTVTDLFFVRHQLRESLRRTLARFAVELRADRDLAS